jgi:hypothetical protein
VLFTGTTGSRSPQAFAEDTATANGLARDDALVSIALDDRTYYLWVNDSIALSSMEIDALLADTLQPGLRSGDDAGAVIALADGMRAALVGATPPGTQAPTAAPATAGATGSTVDGGGTSTGGGGNGGDGGTTAIVLLVVIVGVVVAVGALVLVQQRRRVGADAKARKVVAEQANAQLLALDDLVRDMDQEAEFAEAEFGAQAADPFRQAIAQARTELAAAFAVRQKLDDATPEDAPTRAAMYREIVDRTSRAKALIDAQRASIENLRAVEKRAPELLAALPAKADALGARYAAARAVFTGLQATYAESLWKPVDGNLAEAAKRVEVVRSAAEKGATAIASGDTRTGTQLAVASEMALGQAGDLLGAIERLSADATDASAKIAGVLDETEADLAAAEAGTAAAGPAAAGPASPLASRIREARGLVTATRATLAAPKPDIIAAYRQAAQSAQSADQILAAVRTEADRLAREAATLTATIRAAELEYRRAADFVASRRSGVDREARTRLAEAERHLAAARSLAQSDLARAADEARQADSLAEEAMRLATADFDRYDGGAPPPRGGGGGVDVAGILVGAAIGSMLGGGGRGGGGGFGGTPWGSGGHGGGGGFGGSGGHGGGGGW